VIDFIMN